MTVLLKSIDLRSYYADIFDADLFVCVCVCLSICLYVYTYVCMFANMYRKYR